MDKKFCSQCGNKINDNDVYCENCGYKINNYIDNQNIETKIPNNKKGDSTLFVIVILIVFWIFCGDKLFANVKNDENKTNKPGKYDISVSETALASTYENNILDGNKKYFGKRIKISSNVDEVSDGTFSGLMLFMDKVYCSSFNSNEDKQKLSSLNKGQYITIIGTADTWTSGKLKLKDCEILN